MEEKWKINFVFFFDTNYLLHSINLLYNSRREVKLMTCPVTQRISGDLQHL